jgi:hypothetical protein
LVTIEQNHQKSMGKWVVTNFLYKISIINYSKKRFNMKNKIIKFVLLLNTIDFKTLSNSFSWVSRFISFFLLTVLFSTSLESVLNTIMLSVLMLLPITNQALVIMIFLPFNQYFYSIVIYH